MSKTTYALFRAQRVPRPRWILFPAALSPAATFTMYFTLWNSRIRSLSQLKHEIQRFSHRWLKIVFCSHCSWLWFLSTCTYLSWTLSIISCASLGLTPHIPCLRDLFTHSDSVVLVNICAWLKAQFWLLTSLNLITQTPRASLWLTTYETAMQLLKYVILLH